MKINNTGKFFIILGIGLLIFTAYIVIDGINFSNEWKRVQEKGVSVEATVTNTWSETHSKRSNSDSRSHTTNYYFSVEYYYNGQRYTNPKISYNNSMLSKNNTVTMLIDPDNPSISFSSEYQINPFFSTLTYFIFGIPGLSSIIFGVMIIKGKITSGSRYSSSKRRSKHSSSLNQSVPSYTGIPRNSSDSHSAPQNSMYYSSYNGPSSPSGGYNSAYDGSSAQGGQYYSSYNDPSSPSGGYNSAYDGSSAQDGQYYSSYNDQSSPSGGYNSAYDSSSAQGGQYYSSYNDPSSPSGGYNSAYDGSSAQGGQYDDTFLGTYVPKDSHFNSPPDNDSY